MQTFLKRPPETHKILATIFRFIFNNDAVSLCLRDHASFYYRSLKDNAEEVRRGFNIIESDMSKHKEEKGEINAENDFNSLSLLYKKKESKFIKNYEYFISMRNQ